MHLNSLGLIFDMDGVLIDSTATHTETWRLYLNQQGIKIPELEARMLGKRNDEIVRDFFRGHELSDETVFAHGAKKEQLYRDVMGPELGRYMVPGVMAFLERYKYLNIGLATNGEPANVDLVLNGANIRKYFKAIVSGHDVERPKPYPDIYLKAAGMLGLKPENCIVFEDSLTGIEAARAAGMRVAGLTTTFSKLSNVDLAIPDFLDPNLEPWLQGVAASVSV